MKKISCIIPAYNEEKSIRTILQAVTAISNEFIQEIIVVDDASTDTTKHIVKEFPQVRLHTQDKNKGKSNSVATGVEMATGDYILMLDADLLGLTSENILALIEPVMAGKSDISISMRKNTPDWMKRIKIDFMSGERVLPRGMLMAEISAIKNLRGFGLEVFMNRLIIKNKYKIASVLWSNVENDFKWKKRGFWNGLKKEFLLWVDLFTTITPFEFVRQNIVMSRLVIRS